MEVNILKLYNNESPHVKIIKYPDGQQSCKVDLQYFNVKTPITILCSIRNFSELEVLSCIVAALNKNDRMIKIIEFYYLFGMRSDRAFSEGEPNYFRDIVYPIIKSYNIRTSILAPHNKNMSNFFDGYGVFALDKNINFPHVKIAGDQSFDLLETNFKFHKERTGKNGSIIKVELNKDSISRIKKIPSEVGLLICDDLCDAGGTFIAESKYLKNLFPDKKIYLHITHGLFTKGIDHVADHFEHIYTTNSYQEFSHFKVTATDLFE